MIYKLDNKDQKTLKKLGDIWLSSNIYAHDFIDKNYWIDNYNDVIEAFKDAEIYIYKKDKEIVGFVGLVDNYIAGIFVAENSKNQGIGSKFINFLKREKEELTLKVYKENIKAVKFYNKHSFKIINQGEDETKNIEYTMSWKSK